MLELQIPKNRMNYLIKQMQTHMDPEDMERGWLFHHKGRVSGVELVGGTVVHASVRGNDRYHTTIDLESFSAGDCTCSFDKPCRHMAAVIFALYVPHGRPELLVQELKRAMTTKRKSAKNADRESKRRTSEPVPGGSPEDWHRFFEAQYHGFSISHQYSFDLFVTSAFERFQAFASGWPDGIRLLYDLHVNFFVMHRMEQFFGDTKNSYLSGYHESNAKTAAADCLSRLDRLLASPALPVSVKEHPKRWTEALNRLASLALQGKEGPNDWLYAYRAVWWALPKKAEWIKREKERLDKQLQEREESRRNRKQDVLLVARAHFDLMENNADAAFLRLEALHQRRARDFILYMRRCHERAEWDILLSWLRWLAPTMQSAAQDDFRLLCQYWTDAAKHADADDEWVRIMETLLPRSYYVYTGYLLQTKRYRQWVDLQIANRIGPQNLYALELRSVEESDPSLLLPLYHQAVERSVLEKNRTSYKTAVRLLKKLHGYYTTLGRKREWETYINRLSDHFVRLRAFQEELEKGSWLP
ncbi:SWIM zinc finger family protein [Paenibacillus chitinolyticus]|uniref:SWIM zinc finger domain-containing protein n=2 Tax=Paenibacillus chitinolyticus TaxID=79263 RepID=A0A410X4P3_9BACL|nr:SWIM zinc finger family protein [Paenibacillus chitinolyticus]MCY9593413.1 SWIM zinc finger domain-containing protein [Paenibacillus chitinolyticus]MCY9597071.1 SWIM zinc finger domain-containing protein [Paenibacillus chitinolyticus]QAV21587.1 SWIM zinc finger family protein [Paenibacillus chitinolyticus]